MVCPNLRGCGLETANTHHWFRTILSCFLEPPLLLLRILKPYSLFSYNLLLVSSQKWWWLRICCYIILSSASVIKSAQNLFAGVMGICISFKDILSSSCRCLRSLGTRQAVYVLFSLLHRSAHVCHMHDSACCIRQGFKCSQVFYCQVVL